MLDLYSSFNLTFEFLLKSINLFYGVIKAKLRFYKLKEDAQFFPEVFITSKYFML